MFGIELSSIISTLIGFALLAIAAIGVPVFIIWLLVRVRRGARLREELNTFDFLLTVVKRSMVHVEDLRGGRGSLDALETSLANLRWHLQAHAADLEDKLGMKPRAVVKPVTNAVAGKRIAHQLLRGRGEG